MPPRPTQRPTTQRLVITETHPVQYHAPVYRRLAQEPGVAPTVIYGSDFSVAGYRDEEFATQVAWDTDLCSGYQHQFLSHKQQGGAQNYDAVTPAGLPPAVTAAQPHALLALGYWHPFDRAAIQVALQQGLPLLFRGETNDNAIQRTWWKGLLRDLWLRRLYRRSHALLYVGQSSLRHYQRLGARPGQLHFSPYCVDHTTFTPQDESLRHATRARLHIAPDALVVLYSGKLSDRKGVDLIPPAVRALPPSLRARVHLLFLGDGALRGALESACAGIPTTFTGFQNQSALSAYYLAADLLILPSRQLETWGLVVNEALLHGLPCVVSTRVGCQPDLVIPGQTGALCQPDSAPSLATALQEGLALTRSPSISATCRAQVASYTVDRAAKAIANAMPTTP